MAETLRGKIALVTGGARGLGAAICRTLADAGATVIVADVRTELADEVARTIGPRAAAVRLDVRDPADAEAAVRGAVERHGRLDALVNNAGVDATRPVDEIDPETWDTILGVNLRGPYLMARAALPRMRAQRSGHVVNIVSTAAKRAWANASAYHASKWGLLGLSHALHVEARPHGVKVTAVVAGGMRTPFLLERFPDIDLDTLQDPQHVADTVRYVLCQPAGTVIPEVMVLPMRETSWP